MIFVDAGYLVALVQPGDQLHSRAAAWALALSGPFLTIEHVVWETVNGLSKPINRPKVHAMLDNVRRSSNWEITKSTEDLVAQGLVMHRQHTDKEWSLTDCIAFVAMRQRGLRQALTHDHHFEQAGFEALLRRDPP